MSSSNTTGWPSVVVNGVLDALKDSASSPPSANVSTLAAGLPKAVAIKQSNTTHVFTPVIVSLCAFYYLVSPYYPAARQKSWILTGLGSFCMTMFSLPRLWQLIYEEKGMLGQIEVDTYWSFYANRFFQAYLVSDMLIGALHYRKHVNLLSGWVHHVAYILVTEYTIRKGWTQLFALSAIMELPTFILSLGTLHASLRSDLFFAASFFLTRILFHIALFTTVALPSSRARLVAASWAPAFIYALAFPMHAMWFHGCVTGIIRRRKKVIEARARLVEIEVRDGEKTEVKVEPKVDFKPETDEVQGRIHSEPASLANSRLEVTPAIPIHAGSLRVRRTAAPIASTSTHPITLLDTWPSQSRASTTQPTLQIPPRPALDNRNSSFDRALRTFAATESAKLAAARLLRRIQQSDRYRAFVESERWRAIIESERYRVWRERVSKRIPDRRTVYDYVGLNSGMNFQEPVAVY